jgi:hypothetical protein
MSKPCAKTGKCFEGLRCFIISVGCNIFSPRVEDYLSYVIAPTHGFLFATAFSIASAQFLRDIFLTGNLLAFWERKNGTKYHRLLFSPHLTSSRRKVLAV